MNIIRRVPESYKRKTIVIMGCPRGGTSMISGIFHHSGIFMGDNLGDQYEDPDFHRWIEKSADGKRLREINYRRSVVASRNSKYEIWGFKDTNVTYYFSEIYRDMINPIIVAITRDPLDISRSSSKHDGVEWRFDLLSGAVFHTKIMLDVIQSHGNVPAAVVNFKDARKDPERVVNFISNFSGIELDREKCIDFLSNSTYTSP